MHKLLLVAKHEYLNTVPRRSFVLGTLGLPLLIAAIMAVSIWMATRGEDTRPVGYVDNAGVVLARPEQIAIDAPTAAAEMAQQAVEERGVERPIEMQPFADEASARAALQGGVIQAYYVLPPEYRHTGRTQLYYLNEAPDGQAATAFDALLRSNLLAGQPSAVQQRMVHGIDVTIRSADGSREFGASSVVDVLVPFAAGFFFVFVVLSSAGYLLMAVASEKENRTLEMMATTLSPFQLIGGKSLGLLAAALTQMAVWLGALAIGLAMGARFIPEMGALEMPWSLLLIVALYFFPSYVLVAGLMVAIGSAMSELREGQQIASILNLMFMLPFFFAVIFFFDPNSPLLVALTLFPTTAFITVAMRWSLTSIPAWQLIVSWTFLVMTAGLSILVAARVFRSGMLRYGQRLSLRELATAVAKR